MNTTPRILKKTAEIYKHQVALREKRHGLWHDITWAGYYRRILRVAEALISMGLSPGEKAAIIGDNCPQWVIADLAIQCAGAVSVGIYATSAAGQVQFVVEHSDARVLFVENEEQLDKWLSFRDATPALKKIIVWDTEGLHDFADPMVMTFDDLMDMGDKLIVQGRSGVEDRMSQVTESDVAVLIYTSGTTGLPKGAMLTHRNVTWMATAVAAVNPIFPDDEVLSFLPLCHIFERLFSVFIHITYGYIVNFVEKPDTVTDNMREVSPTVGYGVPRIWEKYYSAVSINIKDATLLKRLLYRFAVRIGKQRMQYRLQGRPVPSGLAMMYGVAYFVVFRKLKERLGFDRLRVAYSGAAPISPEVLVYFQAIGINLIEGYGQTEGAGVTTISKIGAVKFGAVGQVLPDSQVEIAENGEILVNSPGVFAGYYKNPEATRETLVDGWLHTGDVGRIDDGGFLSITDRIKDIIVTAGGKNITPQMIENKLKASIYINDAVVIGDKRKFLSALIVIDEDNVIKYAQDRKLQFSTYKDLTTHADIHRLIEKEVKRVNGEVSRVENIRKFTLIPKKLYEEDGEVTPTMKVKRKVINDAFGDLIESMYTG